MPILINKEKLIIGACAAVFLVVMGWGIFVPYSLQPKANTEFEVKKGMDYTAIGVELQKQGIIKNHGFFTAYVLGTFNYRALQAGTYFVSPSMSVAQIVKKMSTGDVVKNTITIIEGWDIKDIGAYLESKKVMTSAEFLAAAGAKNSAPDYDFLTGRPKNAALEGYLFPDTYQISKNLTAGELVKNMLDNFDKKLTPDLRQEIAKQKKSMFEIITMASLLEKEVKTPDDKKIVAGILWKRLQTGVPLQVDSTINYITGNTTTSTKDTKINSPYNTYKYAGLPAGPISNPGMDSILAAIYPNKNDYWYYLSAPASAFDKSSADKAGHTVFSKTLEEHNIAKAKYLK